MTILEAHIEFDQKLQRVAANVTRDFQPEEKDWFLYLGCLEFIRRSVVPKRNQDGLTTLFQSTKPLFDDVEELVTSTTLPLFKGNNNYELFTILPYNYFLMVDDVSQVKNYCKLIQFGQQTVNKYYCVVPFSKDTTNTPNNLYNGFTISLDSNIIFDLSNYESIYNKDILTNSGLIDNDLNFYIINLVLQELNKSNNLEVRWENYGNLISVPNAFIFISDTPFNNIQTNLNGLNIYNVNTLPFIRLTSNETFQLNKVSNRLIKSELLYQVLNFPFGKSVPHSPVSTMQSGLLKVYHNDTFISDSVDLIYIRRPRKPNLGLNQMCDINPNHHDKIVSLAVELTAHYALAPNLRAVIESNKYINM